MEQSSEEYAQEVEDLQTILQHEASAQKLEPDSTCSGAPSSLLKLHQTAENIGPIALHSMHFTDPLFHFFLLAFRSFSIKN